MYFQGVPSWFNTFHSKVYTSLIFLTMSAIQIWLVGSFKIPSSCSQSMVVILLANTLMNTNLTWDFSLLICSSYSSSYSSSRSSWFLTFSNNSISETLISAHKNDFCWEYFTSIWSRRRINGHFARLSVFFIIQTYNY